MGACLGDRAPRDALPAAPAHRPNTLTWCVQKSPASEKLEMPSASVMAATVAVLLSCRRKRPGLNREERARGLTGRRRGGEGRTGAERAGRDPAVVHAVCMTHSCIRHASSRSRYPRSSTPVQPPCRHASPHLNGRHIRGRKQQCGWHQEGRALWRRVVGRGRGARRGRRCEGQGEGGDRYAVHSPILTSRRTRMLRAYPWFRTRLCGALLMMPSNNQ